MTGSQPLFEFTEPTTEDRDAIWRLAQSADSSAVYLLWLVDYAETSLIARADGQAVGCVVGRRLMSKPDELVVLALAVSPDQNGSRLREHLLYQLIQRMSERHRIRHVEAAVEGPSGRIIARVFRNVARWLDAPITGMDRPRNDAQFARIGPLKP